ncbi:hypothetical protein NKDENANG_02334 [Candidatus Entotheonellaceae bacterium PAL068K]
MQRLAEIARLKRKYGSSIAAILDYRDRLRDEQHAWDRRAERLDESLEELGRLRQSLKSLAVTLSDKRGQTAQRLQQAVQQELHDLNMAGTVFQVACSLRHNPQGNVTVGTQRVALTAEGIDEIEYRVAPNAGQPPKPAGPYRLRRRTLTRHAGAQEYPGPRRPHTYPDSR